MLHTRPLLPVTSRAVFLAWLLALFVASLPGTAVGAGALFSDIGAASGVDFVHFNGMSGELYFPEMMGSGAAVFDYDGDGDLDLYLVQGTMLGPDKTLGDATFPPAAAQMPLMGRLYRNDLSDGEIRFVDVTQVSGLRATGYGMGVATGDIDNDGDVDLYITNFGSNQLWVNNGDGTFSDRTVAAGVDDSRWSVSASFFDYDRDGFLDLYVGNYVNFSFENHKTCRNPASDFDYCSPLTYTPETDRLFRNRGDGSFENVTNQAGIHRAFGGALGVVAADFNGDGWLDAYVANDGVPNQLWLNQHDGTFIDDALLAGAAVNKDGMPEASMGLDAADMDDDGDIDLFMTHLARETNTFYMNDGQGWFQDETQNLGLAIASFPFTGFGARWFDYDNDGRLDIVVANGAVTKIQEQVRSGDPYPLHQSNQLFHNRGKAGYVDVSDEAGPAFALSEVSRGAAFGDLDNDGDTDIVITNNNGPARILRNEVGQDNHWIGLRAVTANGKRDATGALVRVGTRTRRVRSDGSYASAHDPRVIIGLGDDDAAQTVTVRWPDGSTETWNDLPTGVYHTLRQGTGQPAS